MEKTHSAKIRKSVSKNYEINEEGVSAECLDLGFEDLEVAVLQEGKPRRLSQLASREVFKTGLQGIYYRSRYGHDLENGALFEPFQIRITEEPTAIIFNDPDLLRVCQIFGLIIVTRSG